MKTNRDEKGRFGAGNTFGQGRPTRQTERTYLQIVMEECDPDTWRRIVRSVIEDALHGSSSARSWLGGYLVGPPSARLEMLHKLAVEEFAGVDPVEMDAAALEDKHMLTMIGRLGK